MPGRVTGLSALAVGALVALGVALALAPTAGRAITSDRLRVSATVFAGSPVLREHAPVALDEARQENARLADRPVPLVGDANADDAYWSWTGADERGVIATVSVPSLGLVLPVYRGTSDASLARGAGHLPGTSLPVGGASTRCVLAGHTDYRDAELFTHIGSLRQGDLVLVGSVAGTLAYRVRDEAVIAPDDVGALAIEPGKDLLTLLTCYPPSVNTHRLIVTCERADDAPAAAAGPTSSVAEGAPSATGARLPGWAVAGACGVGALACGVLAGGAVTLACDRTSRGAPAARSPVSARRARGDGRPAGVAPSPTPPVSSSSARGEANLHETAAQSWYDAAPGHIRPRYTPRK